MTANRIAAQRVAQLKIAGAEMPPRNSSLQGGAQETESPFQYFLRGLSLHIDEEHMCEMDRQAQAFEKELDNYHREVTALRLRLQELEDDAVVGTLTNGSQSSTHKVPIRPSVDSLGSLESGGQAPARLYPSSAGLASMNWGPAAAEPSVSASSSKRTSPSCGSHKSKRKSSCRLPDNDYTNHILYGSFKSKLEVMEEPQRMLNGPLRVMANFAVDRGWIYPLEDDEDVDEDERRHLSYWTQFCQRVTNGNRFEFICIAMIFLNTLFIGAVTEFEAMSPNETLPTFYNIVGLFFTVWFVAELNVRFGSEGLLRFLFGPQRRWNLFDSIIVAADLLELCLELALPDKENPIMQNSTAFRILRLLRVCRALRVIKFIHFFKNFRIMVMAFVRSGWTLFWALLLLFMIIYVFSIYLTQNVTAYLRDFPDPFSEVQSNLAVQFGSLERAGYTLFKAISGGVSWEVVSDSLFRMDPMSGMGFVFYIFFTVFSLLNIITGVFVDTAISSAQNDDEEVIQAHLQSQDSTVRQLSNFFKAADTDNSGEITLPELEHHFQSSNKVGAQFATMGIAVNEARSMFMMLDADGSGSISIDEFVFGCLRMKGTARSLDLQALMFENKKMIARSSRYYESIMKEVRGFREKQNAQINALDDNIRSRTIIATPSRVASTLSLWPNFAREESTEIAI